MGYCGWSQLGARAFPYGNHGMCPLMFNHAFSALYVPFNYYACDSPRVIKDAPADVRMGALETRLSYVGEYFAMTAYNFPWNINPNVGKIFN